MIIPIKKYIFIGVTEDLKVFYERAQKKGFVEFISPNGRKATDYPEELQKLIEALKILRKQPLVKQAPLVKDLDPFKLALSVVQHKEWKEKLEEDQRLIEAEIARIRPLGYFSLEELRMIEKEANRHIQFFCVKSSKAKKAEIPEGLIYLNTEYDLDYYMSINGKIENYPDLIEMHIDKSFAELEKELHEVRDSLKICDNELKENTAYVDFLKKHLTHGFNQYHLKFSQEEVASHLNGSLFAVEAWVPENRLHSLFPLLEGLGIHAEEIAIEETDRVPTYMENQGYSKAGEDLVHIYDTPATDDKDPSAWVFWSFAVFFALIISDAGYGLIFLSLALFLRWKFSNIKGFGKRFLKLFTVLSCFSIAWGILAGSYFGLNFTPDSPVNKISLMHALVVEKADYHIAAKDETYKEVITEFPQLSEIQSGAELLQKGTKIKDGEIQYEIYNEFRDSVFMEIALLLGVVHICLSLLRRVSRNWAGIGWVFAIIGGYLYFPKILDSTSLVHFVHIVPREVGFKIGVQLLAGGIGFALLLAVIQNRLRGLIEITKVIELFADILSYLRLYALGLAGMILAETFNGMGAKVGFAAGFFIILAGHTINMVVAIMGGVIHGLRLNFIEWYHHSFSGGGKIFNPLKLLGY